MFILTDGDFLTWKRDEGKVNAGKLPMFADQM